MRLGKMLFTCGLMVALLLAAGNATAVTVVVSNQPTGTYTSLGWTETGSLEAAFDVTAVSLIYVTKGKWTAPTSTVKAGVTIRGLGAEPYDVVIDGAGATDATLYVASSGATLDNLTLTGGPNGVKIDPSCSVTMQHCYVRDNKGHGVLCSGTVTMVNCSISGNSGDGVHVVNTATGAASADLSFCSLLYNGGCGVNAVIGGGATTTTSTATVKHSLVTQNGAGGTIPNGSFTLDTLNTDSATPPYWVLTGEWAYGTPLGLGAVTVGNPDPVSGATGTSVLGVNLVAGDYTVPSSTATDTTTTPATPPSLPAITQLLTNPTGSIGDLNVTVNINPDQLVMLRDLTVVLEHSPSGKQVRLFTGSSLSATLPSLPGPIAMVFNDEATTGVSGADETALAAGVKPEQSLSAFDLLDAAQGTWRLVITQSGGAPTGTLNSVTLSVSPMTYATVLGLDFTGYSNPSLRFARWLNMDANSRAAIDVSMDAGVTWTNVWSKGDVQVTDGTWAIQDVALSGVTGTNVAVRWGYYAHPTDAACSGWNLDDITFRGTGTGDTSAGLKAVGTNASITTTQNFVKFHNSGSNYDNVTADTDSTTVEALATSLSDIRLNVADSKWNGKLATDTPYSVLKDKVVSGTNLPANDFEHDLRDGTPDIGADEISSGTGILWYESLIRPEQYYIPAKTQGQLQIELLLRGVDSSTVFATYNSGIWSAGYRVFMLTNARNTDASVTAAQMNVIPLNISRPVGSDIIIGSNAVAISTMGPGSGLGENINDGAGHIVIDDGAATPTQLTPYGQAITGRNFVIDTQAPWLVLNTPATGDLASIFVGGATTYDTRLIERPKDGYGAKAFFNATSSFGMTVGATMSDDFPYFLAPTGALPAAGIVTAGFDSASTGSTTATGETEINNMIFSGVIPGKTGRVFWFPDGDWSVLAQTSGTATVNYTATGNAMTAVWTLPGDLTAAATGLLDTYQIPVHFRGVDRAGNMTTLNNALDPVELWWMRKVQTQLQPGPINGEFKQPHFNWKLLRRKEPYPELANATDTTRFAICPTWPTYQFELRYLNGGAYQFVTPPTTQPISWGSSNVLPFAWFQTNNIMTNPQCVNNWLMLIVSAVNDEAGNSEGLPTSAPVPDILATPYSFGGVQNAGTDNWEVFIPSTNATIDTAASATFWYDTDSNLATIENFMGSQTRMPLPLSNQQLAATFVANFRSLNGPLKAGDQIAWELWRENAGTTLAPTVPNWTLDGSGILSAEPTGEIKLPGFITFPAVPTLPDTWRLPIRYKFVAWAVRTSPPATQDRTPAEVNFSVVDITKEDVTVDTQQPVKVFQNK